MNSRNSHASGQFSHLTKPPELPTGGNPFAHGAHDPHLGWRYGFPPEAIAIPLPDRTQRAWPPQSPEERDAEAANFIKQIEAMMEEGAGREPAKPEPAPVPAFRVPIDKVAAKDPVEKAEIRTLSGELIDLCNPDHRKISMKDVAAALSNICRFTGHVRHHYSVAQHSLLVLWLCEQRVKKADASKLTIARIGLMALLHDASEAYLNDVSKPLKNLGFMAGYRELERKMTTAIYKAVGLPDFGAVEPRATIEPNENEIVKAADTAAYEIEAAALAGGQEGKKRLLSIERQEPEEVEKLYLRAFEHYRSAYARAEQRS